VAALGFGAAVLREAPPPTDDAGATPVTLVQGNIASEARWRSDYYGRNLETYLQLTMDATQRTKSRVAFWPESAMTFFLEDEPLYRAAIGRVLRSADLELVAGGPRTVEHPSRLYFNTTFVVNGTGDISATYDKEHLVPFAEYFPLGIDVLRRHFGRVRYFEHGTQVAPLATRAGLAGVVVCNESMLPEVAGQRVAAGAEYLLNPSNDSWISDPQYSEEQLDISTVRAVEQRRYLVRASTAGPSAVIDPFGRVQVRSGTERQEVLHGHVRASNERTVYGRVGDLFAIACLAVALGALLVRPDGSARPGATRRT
jgi:apolipoprotein N-acyltransferase